MPWCEECARFWNPSSMSADGRCPTCGRVLARTGGDGAPAPAPPSPAADVDAPPRAPWHFKLMLVALVIYLGYRAFQGVEWVLHHL